MIVKTGFVLPCKGKDVCKVKDLRESFTYPTVKLNLNDNG